MNDLDSKFLGSFYDLPESVWDDDFEEVDQTEVKVLAEDSTHETD